MPCSARSRSRSTCRHRWSAASRVRRTSSSPPIAISTPSSAGLKGFINEARLLARFDHPSLVKVYRFWEENGTGYMVMPYYEGPTLKTMLAELGHVPGEAELRTWLKPILNAVTLLHESATWHQNIGPDEILVTPFGPVLLGFAAAAHAIEAHEPHAGSRAQGRLRRDRAVRQRSGDDARALDRPVRARRRGLRSDHRQRAGPRGRPPRQRSRSAAVDRSPPACTAPAS